MRMAEHGWEQLRIHGVPKNRDEREKQEQDDVEDEEDLRYDVEPVGMVGYLVEHDG